MRASSRWLAVGLWLGLAVPAAAEPGPAPGGGAVVGSPVQAGTIQAREARARGGPGPAEDFAGWLAAEEAAPAAGRSQPAEQSPWGALVKVVLWTVSLVGLFIGGLYVLRRFVPATRRMFLPQGTEIVGRVALGPRANVFLLRIGRRIVVVGLSGDRMVPLSEIHDAEEVAALVGEQYAAQRESVTKEFRRVLDAEIDGPEMGPSQDSSAPPEGGEAVRRATDALGRLEETIRRFRGSVA